MSLVHFVKMLLCANLVCFGAFAVESEMPLKEGIFDEEGISRRYLVHVPERKTSDMMPLVLVLHGAGGTAMMAAEKYGWVQKADKESFIVVFPEAIPLRPHSSEQFLLNPNIWNDGSGRGDKRVNDITYLRKVIEEVVHEYPVDKTRIYMTGFSNGASMTFYAGIELSDILAAIAPVSGHLWIDTAPKRAISLLLITGDQDPLNPLNGGLAINPWQKKKEMKPPMFDSVKTWLKYMDLNNKDKHVQEENEATIERFGPDAKGVEVIFIVIKGQGHEWPGGLRALPKKLTGNNVETFHATDVIWEFFKSKTS